MSLDTNYMHLAWERAEYSTCSQLAVGCVLVSPKGTAAAYNSHLPGAPSCADAGHDMSGGKGLHRVVHAELAALFLAAKAGLSMAGGTCYTTHRPCWRCFQGLAMAGIKRIVYGKEYGLDDEVFEHASLLSIAMERFKL